MRKLLPLLVIAAGLAGCGSEQEYAPGKGNAGKPPPAGVMQGGPTTGTTEGK